MSAGKIGSNWQSRILHASPAQFVILARTGNTILVIMSYNLRSGLFTKRGPFSEPRTCLTYAHLQFPEHESARNYSSREHSSCNNKAFFLCSSEGVD